MGINSAVQNFVVIEKDQTNYVVVEHYDRVNPIENFHLNVVASDSELFIVVT